MGPLVYTSGNCTHAVGSAGSDNPSMGPLVYTSGNLAERIGVSVPEAILQWGRWFTPAETSVGS